MTIFKEQSWSVPGELIVTRSLVFLPSDLLTISLQKNPSVEKFKFQTCVASVLANNLSVARLYHGLKKEGDDELRMSEV